MVALLPLSLPTRPPARPPAQVGGSFGALFGLALRWLLPGWHIEPGTYALLCATAVLGGVFRSTFSLVVIVVEGTRGEKGPCKVHSCWAEQGRAEQGMQAGSWPVRRWLACTDA